MAFMAGYVVLRPRTLYQTKTLWGLNNRRAQCGTLAGFRCPSLGRMSLLCPAWKDNPSPIWRCINIWGHAPAFPRVLVCWLTSGEKKFVLTVVAVETPAFGLNINSSRQRWETTCSDKVDIHNRKAANIFALKNLRSVFCCFFFLSLNEPKLLLKM